MDAHQNRLSLALLIGALFAGNGSAAATSVWTEVFTSAVPFSTVSYIDGAFVSVSGTSVARSQDGENWTEQAANLDIRSWCEGPQDGFVGVAKLSNAAWIATSMDLTNWLPAVQVRYVGPSPPFADTLAWACISSTTNRLLCLLDIRPINGFGGPWRYLYSASSPTSTWHEVAYDFFSPHSLASTPGAFYCVASPTEIIFGTGIYSSLDGQTWTRISTEAYPTSYIQGFAVHHDITLSTEAPMRSDLLGVYTPVQNDFEVLPISGSIYTMYGVVHFDGQRIAAAGGTTSQGERFMSWTDDFCRTWQTQFLPWMTGGFASSPDATVAVGSGHFLLLSKPEVVWTNLPSATFSSIARDTAGAYPWVELSVETGVVYQVEICTNLIQGVWSSLGLPFLATDPTNLSAVPNTAGSFCIFRANTLFKRTAN